jgi:hypothetical protein
MILPSQLTPPSIAESVMETDEFGLIEGDTEPFDEVEAATLLETGETDGFTTVKHKKAIYTSKPGTPVPSTSHTPHPPM